MAKNLANSDPPSKKFHNRTDAIVNTLFTKKIHVLEPLTNTVPPTKVPDQLLGREILAN